MVNYRRRCNALIADKIKVREWHRLALQRKWEIVGHAVRGTHYDEEGTLQCTTLLSHVLHWKSLEQQRASRALGQEAALSRPKGRPYRLEEDMFNFAVLEHAAPLLPMAKS